MTQFPTNFSTPVSKLISLGDAAARGLAWPNYAAFGITTEHIPELIRIIQEVEAFWPDEELEADEISAPIHAWRALGQLKTQQAIQPLMALIEKNEELESDWVMEEIPEVMGMIGSVCIPALRAYLLTPGRKTWACVTCSHCLAEIGKQHPDSWADCVAALQAGLEQFSENDETINAFLISYLADLRAVEAVPLVERAYQADVVDQSVMGDFEEFQIALGLLEKRITPPPRYHHFDAPQAQAEWEADKKSRQVEERRQRQQAQKEKKKRKQAAKNRKKGKRK
jgi:hypothetical protein